MFSSIARIRAAGMLGAALAAASLSGCVDDNSSLSAAAPTAPQTAAIPAPQASPRNAPLAIASIQGAPAEIVGRFAQATQTAAAPREITLVDANTAAYLARGYLAAWPVEGGTAIAAVWDLYRRDGRRLQRLDDFVVTRNVAANPWSAADENVINALAARSAARLAAALGDTPEAMKGGAIAAVQPSSAPATLPKGVSAYR